MNEIGRPEETNEIFQESNPNYLEFTLQKKEVCAQRNVPAKRFKICYILCVRKPM